MKIGSALWSLFLRLTALMLAVGSPASLWAGTMSSEQCVAYCGQHAFKDHKVKFCVRSGVATAKPECVCVHANDAVKWKGPHNWRWAITFSTSSPFTDPMPISDTNDSGVADADPSPDPPCAHHYQATIYDDQGNALTVDPHVVVGEHPPGGLTRGACN